MKPSSEQRVFEYLRAQAADQMGIQKIILFGSRARGDATERSDFDIAVEAPTWSQAEWARWENQVREEFPSLCGLDLIRIEPTTSPQLTQCIRREGRILYEKK